jgi:hypothetical protein
MRYRCQPCGDVWDREPFMQRAVGTCPQCGSTHYVGQSDSQGGRFGDWITTSTGKKFWPLDAQEEEIDIQDIGHHLAQLSRYTGACKFPVSVGQHSLYVSWLLESVGPRVALMGLLHDAAEAYFNDVSAPLKGLPMFDAYREAENKLQALIYKKFDVTPTELERKLVKRADKEVQATEVRDAMPHNEDLIARCSGYTPMPREVVWMDFFSVREAFLGKFHYYRSQL